MATNSAITRWKPATVLCTAGAACIGMYIVYHIYTNNNDVGLSGTGVQPGGSRVRRRNAVRHRTQHSQQDSTRISATTTLSLYLASPLIYDITVTIANLRPHIRLTRQLSALDERLQRELEVSRDEVICNLRGVYEEELLTAFLCLHMPVGVRLQEDNDFATAFINVGFHHGEVVRYVVKQYNDGAFDDHLLRRRFLETADSQDQAMSRLQTLISTGSVSQIESSTEEDDGLIEERGGRNATDAESQLSDNLPSDGDDDNGVIVSQDAELLNVAYQIAAGQSSLAGYVHRGFNCCSCNAEPIRGIRYHCAHCGDYDLCEQCEGTVETYHPKTHVFFKVRIPVPNLSYATRPNQPVWYPGIETKLFIELRAEDKKRLAMDNGLEEVVIEGLWDQFKCVAAVRWKDDPDGYGMALDRDNFDDCFLPKMRNMAKPKTTIIFDRIFLFYDTNDDGLIGFEEFVAGVASLRSKDASKRFTRIFRCYDHDGDGYVGRRDCLLLLKAAYEWTHEFTREMMNYHDPDMPGPNAIREHLSGTRPISTIIPPDDDSFGPARPAFDSGKRSGPNGKSEIVDGGGIISEATRNRTTSQVVADYQEARKFNGLQSTAPIDSETYSKFAEDESTTLSEKPGFVTDEDVARASRYSQDFTELSHSRQLRVLRIALRRYEAEDRNARHGIRMDAVQTRHKRLQFYLDEVEPTDTKYTTGEQRVLPTPDENPNRELLYNVMMEGLNGMLDPIFEERERDALAGLASDDPDRPAGHMNEEEFVTHLKYRNGEKWGFLMSWINFAIL